MFKYNFVIDYRSKTKNSIDDLLRRSNLMISMTKKIENNRQILHQLQISLRSKSKCQKINRVIALKTCLNERRKKILQFRFRKSKLNVIIVE